MLVVMKPHASQAEIDAVVEKIRELGLTPHPIPGAERVAIGITGNKGALEAEPFTLMSGVADAIRVSQPFKLVSREVKEEDTIIDVGGVPLGGPTLAVMAGPCSVESREQLLEAAHAVKAAGARFLRGGAFKPRTSPYEFQGLAEEGLKLLALAREQTGLKVVTEVMDVETLPMVCDYADVLQIGARNMQNYSLLKQLGSVQRPILLKRGPSATVKEWLMAAEYVVSRGNYQVALCERGIRTFETDTRNTLDLAGAVWAGGAPGACCGGFRQGRTRRGEHAGRCRRAGSLLTGADCGAQARERVAVVRGRFRQSLQPGFLDSGPLRPAVAGHLQALQQLPLGVQFQRLQSFPQHVQRRVVAGSRSPVPAQPAQRGDHRRLPGLRQLSQHGAPFARAAHAARLQPGAAEQQADIGLLRLQLQAGGLDAGAPVQLPGEGPQIARHAVSLRGACEADCHRRMFDG